jgi:hypothetical protein
LSPTVLIHPTAFWSQTERSPKILVVTGYLPRLPVHHLRFIIGNVLYSGQSGSVSRALELLEDVLLAVCKRESAMCKSQHPYLVG